MPFKKIVKTSDAVVPVAKPEVSENKIKTDSDKIWEEIRNVQMNMFSLPDQTVEKYFKPIMVEPSKLYLTLAVSSALVALEDAIGKQFDVVPAGKFIIVSRK